MDTQTILQSQRNGENYSLFFSVNSVSLWIIYLKQRAKFSLRLERHSENEEYLLR